VRWIILLVLFLARMTMSFQFQSVGSAAPFLTSELGLSYVEVGTLIGTYLVPGTVLAIPTGLLQARFGEKRVCASGLLLMAIGGVALGLSDNYLLALLGRVVSGAGAVLLNLVIAKMVADWFVGHEISFAMATVAVSWGVGISVGLMTQGKIASGLGLNGLMYVVALSCVLALMLVLIIYRAPPSANQPHTAGRHLPSSIFPEFRIAIACLVAGAIWGLFNAGLVNFFSFTPEYLTSRGLTSTESTFFTSTALWISILAVPVSGYLVHLVRKPDFAICLFSALTGLTLVLLAVVPSAALISCVMAGVLMAPPIGAILALPARVAPAAQRAGAIGLFYSCYYVVATIGPTIAGALRDVTGDAATPVLFGATLFIIVPVIIVPFWSLTRYATLRG